MKKEIVFMELDKLGFHKDFLNNLSEADLKNFEIGRVISEQKESYFVETEKGRSHSQITGNLRFSAKSRLDFPAVGDWVLLTLIDNSSAIINKILPRKSILQRKVVNSDFETQILSTNVDYVIIVQSLDQNYNLNRLERYLVISNVENVQPIILFNKSDLIDDARKEKIKEEIEFRIKNIPFIFFSNYTGEGKEEVSRFLKEGNTFCVIGSSGVGKSTFINSLSEMDYLKTSEISNSNSKGMHTTTHRELIVTEKYGILIDTPGMRELGIAEHEGSLNATFNEISTLAENCKFKNCSHSNELGCAILEAIENQTLSIESFQSYNKLKREQNRFSMSIKQKRDKDKKLGKLYKSVQGASRKNKSGI